MNHECDTDMDITRPTRTDYALMIILVCLGYQFVCVCCVYFLSLCDVHVVLKIIADTTPDWTESLS